MQRLLCCLTRQDSPGVTSHTDMELKVFPPNLVAQTPTPVLPSVSAVTWQYLPQELLIKITSKLDNSDLIALRLVSQAWKRAASRQLTALIMCCEGSAKSRTRNGMEDKEFLLACAAFPSLHKVDTCSNSVAQLTSQGLLAGLALLPNLDTLYLNPNPIMKHRAGINRGRGYKFATGRHALRLDTGDLARLTALVGQLRSQDADATKKPASMASIYLDMCSLQPLTNLRALALSGMKGLGRSSTLDLAKLTHLRQLETLDVSYFDHVVCKGVMPLGLKTLRIDNSGIKEADWLSACASLQIGGLVELSLISISESLPPFFLESCGGLTQLTSLSIGKCCLYDYTKYPADVLPFHLVSFHSVLRGLTNLARLDLDWGWRVAHHSIEILSGHSNLTYLGAGFQSQWCRFQDLGMLTRLKSYAMCCGHSNDVASEERALKAALSRLPHLTTLSLLGDCSGLIWGISHQITGLSQLVLDYRCIKDVSEVASLAALSNMAQLRTLIIVLCCHKDCVQSFTDTLLEAVSEAASVQYLLITGNAVAASPAPLTGEGLRHLTRMLRLKKVQLVHWSGGFTNLRHVDLKAVMRGLPDLQVLRLCGGHRISARMVAALHRSFPRVRLDLSSLGYRSSDLSWES